MPSFDIVSEVNMQEIDNAINQARKEVSSRYDLRGKKAEYEWDKKEIGILSDEETRVSVLRDILQGKLHHRGIDIASVQFDPPQPVGGMLLKQKAKIVQGIEREVAQRIVKFIRDSRLKVQAQIDADKIKVSSKSIDTLQECIQLVKSEKFAVPLQFKNMRS